MYIFPFLLVQPRNRHKLYYSKWSTYYFFLQLAATFVGLPRWLSGKESSCNAGLIPRLGRSPRERARPPTPLFLPGESHWEEHSGLQSIGSQTWLNRLSTHSHSLTWTACRKVTCISKVLAIACEKMGALLWLGCRRTQSILFSWVGSSSLQKALPCRLRAHTHILAPETKQDPVAPPWVQKPLHVPVSLWENGFSLWNIPWVPKGKLK